MFAHDESQGDLVFDVADRIWRWMALEAERGLDVDG